MSEIGRRVGVTAERTKDRAREGIIDGDQVRKKNPTAKVSPFF